MSVASWPVARWRVFGEAVAGALGINVWISLVLLPGLFVGAYDKSAPLTLALMPLVVLGIGIWRRSDSLLLLGFPSALLAPVAVAPQMITMHVYGPIRFGLVAVGLVAFLFGASILTSFYEPPPPRAIRPLASAAHPIPHRWRRRFRIYAGLAILSTIFPVVLIGSINFDKVVMERMQLMYSGRGESFATLLNLGALALWLFIFVTFFLGILKPHRTGDQDLRADIARLKRDTARGRPRPVFYVGVLAALLLMIALMYLSNG